MTVADRTAADRLAEAFRRWDAPGGWAAWQAVVDAARALLDQHEALRGEALTTQHLLEAAERERDVLRERVDGQAWADLTNERDRLAEWLDEQRGEVRRLVAEKDRFAEQVQRVHQVISDAHRTGPAGPAGVVLYAHEIARALDGRSLPKPPVGEYVTRARIGEQP